MQCLFVRCCSAQVEHALLTSPAQSLVMQPAQSETGLSVKWHLVCKREQHTGAQFVGFVTTVSVHVICSQMTSVGMHADHRSKRLASGELCRRKAATRLKTKRDGC